MTTRNRGRYGQLLLFAALLFGIVTMHTLGHPSEHGPGHGPDAGTEQMAYGVHLADAGDAPSAHGAGSPMTDVTATTATTSMTSMTSMTSGMPPMSGMDPLSVCLAVLLGGFTLLLLLATALGRPGAAAVHPAVLTRLLRALWPVPPPPRTLLSRLSVLRI